MLQATDLINEIVFSTSRSSGPGGQNVNKVNSKVTLNFDIIHSTILTLDQKDKILHLAPSRFTRKGMLVLTSQDDRSQLKNKAIVLEKLDALLIKVFSPVKARKATKPKKSSKLKRLNSKKLNGEKKKLRQRLA